MGGGKGSRPAGGRDGPGEDAAAPGEGCLRARRSG